MRGLTSGGLVSGSIYNMYLKFLCLSEGTGMDSLRFQKHVNRRSPDATRADRNEVSLPVNHFPRVLLEKDSLQLRKVGALSYPRKTSKYSTL